jgi:hypothetical protein
MTLRNRIALRRLAADLARTAEALLALADMEDGLARVTTLQKTAKKTGPGKTTKRRAVRKAPKRKAVKRPAKKAKKAATKRAAAR